MAKRAEPGLSNSTLIERTLSVTYIFEGFQKQRPFVAESVIHALSPDVHDAHQVIGGRGGKALLRKKAYRLPKGFLLIELLRSSHAPLRFLYSLCDYATYPPSMVRLAPVMKPASSDAR